MSETIVVNVKNIWHHCILHDNIKLVSIPASIICTLKTHTCTYVSRYSSVNSYNLLTAINYIQICHTYHITS